MVEKGAWGRKWGFHSSNVKRTHDPMELGALDQNFHSPDGSVMHGWSMGRGTHFLQVKNHYVQLICFATSFAMDGSEFSERYLASPASQGE